MSLWELNTQASGFIYSHIEVFSVANPCEYRPKLQILPEDSHEVPRGPALDEGPPGCRAGLPSPVRAVGSPHAAQGILPLILKVFSYLEKEANRTCVILFLKSCGSSL